MSQIPCPIWGTQAEVLKSQGDKKLFDSSRAGGKFWITGSAIAATGDRNTVALSSYILSENLRGEIPYIDSYRQNALKVSQPLTTAERFNQLLKLMRVDRPELGDGWPTFFGEDTDPSFDKLYAAIELEQPNGAEAYNALNEYWRHAEELGLIRRTDTGVSLTVQGFQYLDELGLQLSDSPQLFVAMWFGGQTMRQLYEEAIKPAIEAARYSAMRIDNSEHNEKIDDQIMAEIRKSKAVVVDLSCGTAKPIGDWSTSNEVGAPRGGVYYEAGFAKGLKLPVVWMVDQNVADIENVVHFDTRQYNQIRWSDDFSETKERLKNRLVATLGQGPIAINGPAPT